jgi:hypothetical protein
MENEEHMPELGNMLFGNSRGEFPMERNAGYEHLLFRLLRKINKEEAGYGSEFENGVFSVFPYYWGDCTCGFQDHEFKGEHDQLCYQIRLRDGILLLGKPSKRTLSWMKEEERVGEKLCKELGLPFPDGWGVHCTCDYNERYVEWMSQIGYPDGCREDCLLLKPNFLYKPTGFNINWYKYPLRDSYTNMKISLDEFDVMIDDCVKSLSE